MSFFFFFNYQIGNQRLDCPCIALLSSLCKQSREPPGTTQNQAPFQRNLNFVGGCGERRGRIQAAHGLKSRFLGACTASKRESPKEASCRNPVSPLIQGGGGVLPKLSQRPQSRHDEMRRSHVFKYLFSSFFPIVFPIVFLIVSFILLPSFLLSFG